MTPMKVSEQELHVQQRMGRMPSWPHNLQFADSTLRSGLVACAPVNMLSSAADICEAGYPREKEAPWHRLKVTVSGMRPTCIYSRRQHLNSDIHELKPIRWEVCVLRCKHPSKAMHHVRHDWLIGIVLQLRTMHIRMCRQGTPTRAG